MNILDMRTINFTYLLTTSLCAFLMFSSYKHNERYRTSLFYWLCDLCCMSFSLILIAFRGIIPDFISIVVSNTLISFGFILILFGAENFYEKKFFKKTYLLIFVFYPLLLSYFTYVYNSLETRIIIISIVIFTINFMCFHIFWNASFDNERKKTNMLSIIFLIFCAVSAYRGIMAYSFQRGNNFFQDFTQPDALSVLLYLLLVIARTYGFLSLVNNKVYSDFEKANDDLTESEKKFFRLFEDSPIPYMLTDSDTGRFILVNHQFYSLFKYEPEEIEEKNIEELGLYVSLEDRKRLLIDIKKANMVNFREIHFRKKTGEICSCLVNSSEINMNGKYYILTGMIDITDEERMKSDLDNAKAQLIQQEKMASIGQLAAGIAHEINNPLGYIKGNMDSLEYMVKKLLKEVQENEEHKPSLHLCAEIEEIFEDNKEGIERICTITKSLRSFSYSEKFDLTLFDLNAGIKSTLVITNNEVKYIAKVDLELGEIPMIMANSSEINQVLLNMILNAAYSIKEKHKDAMGMGTIHISTNNDENYVILTIEDDGSGIPEKTKKRIFEPFFTTKPIGKGTGLGLSLAYDTIVNRHHGTIEVLSEVGSGAKFIIKLPIIQKTEDAVEST